MKTIMLKLLLLSLTVICLNAQAQTIKYVTMSGAGYKDGSSWEHAYDSTGIQIAIDAMTTSSGCNICLLYTSPSPRDVEESRMPSSA